MVSTFRSPGVITSEVEVNGPPAVTPTGTPACVISPTVKGPAFVPTTVTSLPDFVATFGGKSTDTPNGYLAAREWFSNTNVPLVHIRTLGAGRGETRNGDGTVSGSGFVVGAQQPVESSGGALGHNPYANTGGVTGSVYVLGCFMSESAGSTIFSDASLQTTTGSVPIVRGVLFAPSGVVLRLSSAASPSAAPASYFVPTEAVFSGAFTGSVDISSGKQTFVMLLNGHKGTDTRYPNVITASFDPQAVNYFANVFNTDPLKTQEAGHLLYSFFDVYSALAVPTGSGVIVAASGSSFGSVQNIAFLTPTSGAAATHTSNVGSSVTPNYENFEDRYGHAFSPWVISQNFGGTYYNLFKFHHRSDGEAGNADIKISILNIQPGTPTQPYGKFDVLVRKITDRDETGNMVILESFTNCSLDPTSPNYIAKRIGTEHTFFDFDTDTASQRVVTTGTESNRSRYVRVEVADIVENMDIDPSAVPFGFRGPQHLVTGGSSSLYDIRQGDLINTGNPYFATNILGHKPLYKAAQPPVPMRLNLKKAASSAGVDTNLFWGVQFQKQTSVTDINGSALFNPSILGFSKYYPNLTGSSNVQMAVFDNTGTAATDASNILDSDVFNNNLFCLDKIKVVTGSNGLPDVSSTALLSWSYVRAGNIVPNSAAKTRALAVNDLTGSATVQALAKFSFYLERGFDGVRIFNSDTRYMTNAAITQELDNTSRGLTNGATVQSFMKALEVVSDVNDLDVQVLAVPGVRARYVTDNAITTVEQDRFDCFYIMDPEQYDALGNNLTGSYTNVSATQTALQFTTRAVNSSFAGSYFPDTNIRLDDGTVFEKVPPSVAVLGAFAKNDAVAQPFNAPAGFTRGTLTNVSDFAVALNKTATDTLYVARINPLLSKQGVGPVVWGQKNLLNKDSLLNRVNVRRLLIALRREIRQVSNRFMFEPAKESTLQALEASIKPILSRYKSQGGIENFRIDFSGTTQSDFDNKTIRGQVFIVPTTSLEFLSIDFVVTNKASFVSG